ncbi:MAG: OB-fold domain-containing protein [Pseudomonadota bacterium]|nr:OB-fold domain-containing protein [Pseudomonadota bacterium]
MQSSESNELVAPGLLRWKGKGWALIGSRCQDCGEHFFPAQQGCANCCGTNVVEVELGDHGILWSWTVQDFEPKTPFNGGTPDKPFLPYGVGYVEMPSGIKVESRLTVSDPGALKIGMRMELVTEAYRTRADGSQVHTFAFKPAGAAK